MVAFPGRDSGFRSAVTSTPRDYLDRFNDPIADVRLFATLNSAATEDVSHYTKRPFPQLLYEMLEQASCKGFDNIVSWAAHGRAFRIHHRQQFERFVLPRYFQTKKLSSFLRQLFLYKFHRSDIGRNEGSWFHECFLRGRPDLTSNMNRESQRPAKPGKKGVRPGRSSTRTWNVDLYKFPRCLPSSSLHHSLVASNIPARINVEEHSVPDHDRLQKCESSMMVCNSSLGQTLLTNDSVSFLEPCHQGSHITKQSCARHTSKSRKPGTSSDMKLSFSVTQPIFNASHENDFSPEWNPKRGGSFRCNDFIHQGAPNNEDDDVSRNITQADGALMELMIFSTKTASRTKEDASDHTSHFASRTTSSEGNAITAATLFRPLIDNSDDPDSASLQQDIPQIEGCSKEELPTLCSGCDAGATSQSHGDVINSDELYPLHVFRFQCAVAEVGKKNAVAGAYHL